MLSHLISQATYLGLATDIIGAIVVSKSVFARNNKEIFNTSGGFWGYSRKNTIEGISAKREAIFGCILLVLGFVGQLIGSIDSKARIDWATVIYFATALTILSVTVDYLIANWTKKTADYFIAEYEKNEESSKTEVRK